MVYGGTPSPSNQPAKVTVQTLRKRKAGGERITMLACYDYPTARMVDRAGIDGIIVGDSLSMVIQGQDSTLSVTLEEMLYHTRLVAKAAQRTMVIGDMPFLSYQASTEQAIRNAGRFLKEAAAHAVKLEGGVDVQDQVRAITRAGIPVMGHIGLTPQSMHQLGGFRVQRQKEKLVRDAESLQEAGAFAIILEAMPPEVGAVVTRAVSIPTIGIGAGPDCDGQVLVLHDMLGLTQEPHPKFVKQYAHLASTVMQAIDDYRRDVLEGRFPAEEHCYQ